MKKIHLLICATLCLSTLTAQPTANFAASPTSGCAPLLVRFTDLSTGNPASYRWDLGNGTITTLQNPVTTYFNPGTYTVKLVVTNAGGSDSVIRTNYITVHALPAAEFTANNTTGCFPFPVQFTDQSVAGSGTITSWEWDFGDGNISSEQNPRHVYRIAGNFNVTLRVTNSFGCSQTIGKTQYIVIPNGVTANFTNAPPSDCKPPADVLFNNLSTGPAVLTYQWDFGDGQTSAQQSPVHTYTTGGNFTVRLIVSSSGGCTDTISKSNSITIGNVQSSFSGPDTVCLGKLARFQNLSVPNPSSSVWDFGDGTTLNAINASKTYTAAGTYTVTLSNNFGGCFDDVTRLIHVIDTPVANFVAINNVISCRAPFTINFQDQSTGAVSWLWDFGDGTTSTQQNPIKTYTRADTFNVRLTVTNAAGCQSAFTRIGYIRIIPPVLRVNGIPARGCVPLTVTPTANITSIDGVASYFWDFGDGFTSTAANPSHTYNAVGSYTVKLRITTNGGCQDSLVFNPGVRVGTLPATDFVANPLTVCVGENVSFTDLTPAPVDEWYWEFGSGPTGTSTLRNPVYVYQDTGAYTVRLTSFNNGCSDLETKTNYIRVIGAVANFTSAVDCNNRRQVTFTNLSKNYQAISWDFGDGNTSTVLNPVHTYPAGSGIYNVKLTATNGSCTHVLTRQVRIVFETADFVIDPNPTCRFQATYFRTINSADTNISRYDWDFGSGVFVPAPRTVSTSFSNTGDFVARLIITDINGCKDTTSKPFRINGPLASFNATNTVGCKGLTANFNDLSTTDGVNNIIYKIWTWGDGRVDTINNAPYQHTYPNAGIYTVKLKIIDASGCADSVTSVNLVRTSDPKAAYIQSDTSSCPSSPIQFTNQSTGSIVSNFWDFGNGFTSTLLNPTLSYINTGTFNVKLRITDSYGCSDSVTKPITIDRPVATFDLSDTIGTCPPLAVNFTFTGSYNKTIRWDFGDGGTSALANPTHFYTLPGTYIARLTVTSPGGCTDVSTRTIRVFGPNGTISYTPNGGCMPLDMSFNVVTTGVDSVIWDFDNGIIFQTKGTDTTYTYNVAGSYLPRAILQDATGCRVPISGIDTVKVVGIIPKFGASKKILCDRGIVQFTDSTITNGRITNWLWDFGDGATSTQQNPSHTYTTPGDFNVMLTVVTEFGCTESVTVPAYIKLVNSPVTDIAGLTEACEPATLNFNGVVLVPDNTIVDWFWSFGNGQTSTLQNPLPQNYLLAGNYTVQMYVTNSSGCIDTVIKNVTIHPLPVTDAGADTTICLGQTIQLNATGAATYQWQPPASNLNCTNCPSPLASPIVNTTYYVKGITGFGCEVTDSVRVFVKQPFTVTVSPDAVICVGQTAQLTSTGAELYSWDPPTGLNNANIASPVAKPATTTTYTVTGRDNKNCFTSTGSVTVTVYPIPTVNAGPDLTIPVGSSLQLNTNASADVTNILWSPAASLSCTVCPNPVATPKVNTTYTVTVSNDGNCIATDFVTVFVTCTKGNLYIPNTFSPNGDGMNDIFYPRGRGISAIKALRVFNRWGQIVFEKQNFNANDASSGWDGTFKGTRLTPDVYVYIIDVVCENNTLLTFKGDVSLIR
ncbi:MAG: PKD domain-containing protein [Chitinophagaceae bacterium]|nr:PKD domain-containing protein [Chitinophagaceae bacterium]